MSNFCRTKVVPINNQPRVEHGCKQPGQWQRGNGGRVLQREREKIKMSRQRENKERSVNHNCLAFVRLIVEGKMMSMMEQMRMCASIGFMKSTAKKKKKKKNQKRSKSIPAQE